MTTSLFSATDPRFEEVAVPGSLCAFDFDGTIAPIVRTPERVAVPAAISRRLALLQRYTYVAIITGRSVGDVASHIGMRPHYIIGNHGLEGLPDTPPMRETCAPVCAKWEEEIARAISDTSKFGPGIWIENKGHSISVHYRLAEDKIHAQEALDRLFRQLAPAPRVVGGKCVFNLLPVTDMNKGVALVRLMQHCGATHAFYVGDDDTDEDIFELKLKNLLTVRIGRNEKSRADAYIHHRLDMAHLLDELIKRLTTGDLRSVSAK